MSLKQHLCPNSSCQVEFSICTDNYFIELPVGQQHKTLLSRKCIHACIIHITLVLLYSYLRSLIMLGPGFSEMLQYRFTREKKSPHHVEDIFDGSIYRELSRDGGPLSRPEGISFTINTDGVDNIFKSRKASLWPVYLMINELPPSQRYSFIWS